MRYLLPLILLLASCAETKTQDEIEWDRAMDRENWALCEKVYQQSGVVTYHVGHSHQKGRKIYPHEIKSDLAMNDCRQVLGPYWAE